MLNIFPKIIVWLIVVINIVLRRLHKRLSVIHEKMRKHTNLNTHEVLIKRTAARYDMNSGGDESYYASFYNYFITEQIKKHYKFDDLSILDLACGQGRTILALLNSQEVQVKSYVGVDFSKEALNKASKYFKKLSNIYKENINYKFENKNIIEYLEGVQDNSLDCVWLLEVLYMVEKPEFLIRTIVKKLKKNGIFFLTFRPELYYVLSLLDSGLIAGIDLMKNSSQGDIYNSGVVLNWSCADKIKSQLSSDYGLILNGLIGVGVASGIQGDPHSKITQPSHLTSKEQKILMDSEVWLGLAYPDSGRYILCSCTKI